MNPSNEKVFDYRDFCRIIKENSYDVTQILKCKDLDQINEILERAFQRKDFENNFQDFSESMVNSMDFFLYDVEEDDAKMLERVDRIQTVLEDIEEISILLKKLNAKKYIIDKIDDIFDSYSKKCIRKIYTLKEDKASEAKYCKAIIKNSNIVEQILQCKDLDRVNKILEKRFKMENFKENVQNFVESMLNPMKFFLYDAKKYDASVLDDVNKVQTVLGDLKKFFLKLKNLGAKKRLIDKIDDIFNSYSKKHMKIMQIIDEDKLSEDKYSKTIIKNSDNVAQILKCKDLDQVNELLCKEFKMENFKENLQNLTKSMINSMKFFLYDVKECHTSVLGSVDKAQIVLEGMEKALLKLQELNAPMVLLEEINNIIDYYSSISMNIVRPLIIQELRSNRKTQLFQGGTPKQDVLEGITNLASLNTTEDFNIKLNVDNDKHKDVYETKLNIDDNELTERLNANDIKKIELKEINEPNLQTETLERYL